MKLIGRGATAEVFDCGDGTVCKLFIPGCPVDAVKREYDNACLMEDPYWLRFSEDETFEDTTRGRARRIMNENRKSS